MLLLSVTFLPALAIPGMFIYMQMTPPNLLLVKVLMKLLLLSTLWYRMCCSGAWIVNSLYIHGPIKTEAMLIRKSPFNGPLPPLCFGFGHIRLVESSTCLGVKLDNRLSWPDHTSQVRKCFAQKVGALKRMKYLPVETLQEIYLFICYLYRRHISFITIINLAMPLIRPGHWY